MKTYNYLQIQMLGHLTIRCTDSETLKWIVEVVKNRFPNCNVLEGLKIQDGTHYLDISRLDGADENVNWWVMKELAKRGWEVFSISHAGGQGPVTYYHFRLASDSE